MSSFRLIFKEIAHRRFNFLFSSLAVLTAVALFIFFHTTGVAAKQEARVVLKNMGFNLRIIPKETEMDKFYAEGFSENTMPEEYVYRFAKRKGLYYAHLMATLQRKVTWRGRSVILTGILPEVSPPGKKKKPLGFTVKLGTVYVGYEIARSLGIKEGDVIDLFGRSFTVTKTLSQTGSKDDIRIYGHLHDIQKVLGLEGRINEIKALECVCYTLSPEEFRKTLRQQLARILPDAKVIQLRAIALARRNQRWMIERYFSITMPFVIIVCAVWIGALAMMNVRERRYEIGIMRALGYGSGRIALLFLGRAVAIGLVGAALGFLAGTLLSITLGPDIFKVTARMIKPIYGLLGWSLIAAPAFAALSSFIPAMVAVTQDPAYTLREV
ncbi:TPA: FtsX-like permease family protein [Candidatus Poribacteria bacterium]|nr:FtsX-like permease family protein [Candidatus Poribacteria bacterium]